MLAPESVPVLVRVWDPVLDPERAQGLDVASALAQVQESIRTKLELLVADMADLVDKEGTAGKVGRETGTSRHFRDKADWVEAAGLEDEAGLEDTLDFGASCILT